MEEKQQKVLEIMKYEDDGITAEFGDNTEVLDVLIGIGITIDMIIEQKGVTKEEVMDDINTILDTIKEESKKEEGENKDGSK